MFKEAFGLVKNILPSILLEMHSEEYDAFEAAAAAAWIRSKADSNEDVFVHLLDSLFYRLT